MLITLIRTARRALRRHSARKRRAAYNAYMSSPEWRAFRRKVFDRDRYLCVYCGAGGRLECHHLTYKRFGRERLSDCVTVCPTCHKIADQRRKKARWI